VIRGELRRSLPKLELLDGILHGGDVRQDQELSSRGRDRVDQVVDAGCLVMDLCFLEKGDDADAVVGDGGERQPLQAFELLQGGAGAERVAIKTFERHG
jgi:hypothetical protein